MGILNVTPDSFYKESRKVNINSGIKTVKEMIANGADIIDIGGESSRPGADYVSEDEEKSRVIPIIKAIRNFSDIPLSIDTRKATVAEESIRAGADIINDISALKDDKKLGDIVAKYNIPIVLMHMQGNPKNMQINPSYENTLNDIIKEIKAYIKKAKTYGIKDEKIIIDPGIGFGKRLNDNLLIIKNIDKLKKIGYPTLIGLSRKSFIGTITNTEPENRLSGTIAANMFCVFKGIDILRVHDIKATADMLDIFAAIENGV